MILYRIPRVSEASQMEGLSNHQYGLCLETQFSQDLEKVRIEPGPPGRNPSLYLRATVFLKEFIGNVHI